MFRDALITLGRPSNRCEDEPRYKRFSRVTEVILAEKKYTLEMVGKMLREAGTLIIVFAPLYQLFEPHTPYWGMSLRL